MRSGWCFWSRVFVATFDPKIAIGSDGRSLPLDLVYFRIQIMAAQDKVAARKRTEPFGKPAFRVSK